MAVYVVTDLLMDMEKQVLQVCGLQFAHCEPHTQVHYIQHLYEAAKFSDAIFLPSRHGLTEHDGTLCLVQSQ